MVNYIAYIWEQNKKLRLERLNNKINENSIIKHFRIYG